jgi:DNA-damage-inducible protein J
MIQICPISAAGCAAANRATTNPSAANMIIDNTTLPTDKSAAAVADTYVHARIDTPTKQRATDALHRMGLSVSDAIRMLMQHLASERCLPPGMKAPGVAAANQLAQVKDFPA